MNNFFSYVGRNTFIKLKMTYRNSKYIPSNQCIQNNKDKQIFCENDRELILNQYDFIKNKKLISISPGGYKGVYILGTCMYIRKHFNLDDFIFSGASAGAWNALLLCYKKDPIILKEKIVDYNINRAKSLKELEELMKTEFLNCCSSDDFDFRRLFIGVTTIENYKSKANTTIFSGFTSLEDAIDCCIASSHIPLITGGFINKYSNKFTFDGGFSKYPYLSIIKPVLHITPSMWKPIKNTSIEIPDYTTLFLKNKFNFTELYNSGYEDAEKNMDIINKLLNSNDLS
jgi:hypothetical protein